MKGAKTIEESEGEWGWKGMSVKVRDGWIRDGSGSECGRGEQDGEQKR